MRGRVLSDPGAVVHGTEQLDEVRGKGIPGRDAVSASVVIPPCTWTWRAIHGGFGGSAAPTAPTVSKPSRPYTRATVSSSADRHTI